MKKIDIDKTLPLQEYPRPQFQRDSYLNLNGAWQYAISKSKSLETPTQGIINVPYSPESELSGVGRQLKKDEYLHYVRNIIIPKGFNKGRVLLNIGAIDQRSEIYINNQLAGQSSSPYIPVQIDITPYLHKEGEEDNFHIVVMDDADSEIYARGKQRYNRGGVWYTAISGIWQSVFLESVPQNYIKSLKIDTKFDENEVRFSFNRVGNIKNITLEIFDEDKRIAKLSTENSFINYRFDKFKAWSTDNPFLYQIKIRYKDDEIDSYFGMRKISLINIDGAKICALNNKPILLKGVLDQGYYQKGIYTVEKYEDYVKDIELIKSLGFNMIRKHIKIEPMRFYYECDKRGIIVLQDFVNGGKTYKISYVALRPIIKFDVDDINSDKLGRKNEKSRDQFLLEVQDTISLLYNTPSVCAWTVFNEGWGQFDAYRIAKVVKGFDESRLVDATSGWFDKGSGDFNSQHIYFRKINMKNDHKRALFLSEFGGYSLSIKDHMFSNKKFGYRFFNSIDKLSDAISELFIEQVKPQIIKENLTAYVYTQLSDVEQEINGFITYDREVIKVDIEKIKKANEECDIAFYEKYR